jgi:hypothetical protein
MGFSEKQKSALRRSPNQAHIRTRHVQGRELSYIEGWHAVSEANRIFGFDRWDRETVDTKCIVARESRDTLYALYMARVRVTVRADGEIIIREGYGTGEGHGTSPGAVHERALKMAETDATKRALATFGKPFGLALYVSSRQNLRSITQPTSPIPDGDRRRTAQRLGSNGRYHIPHKRRVSIDPVLAAQASASVEGDSTGPHFQEERLKHEKSQDLKSSLTPPLTRQTSEEANPTPPMQFAGASKSPVTNTHSDVGPNPSQNDTRNSKGDPSEAELLIERPKRRREPAHLRFVMSQPCLICGRSPSDAHHLRFAQPRALGRKVSDEFTVPLCRVHHRQVHQSGNEVQWWRAVDQDIDPLEIAKGLWEDSRRRAQGIPQSIASLP